MVELRNRTVRGKTARQQERRRRVRPQRGSDVSQAGEPDGHQERLISNRWEGIPRTRRSRGLVNPDGTQCYRNSVLQALLHIPKFLNWLEGQHTNANCRLCYWVNFLSFRIWRLTDFIGIVNLRTNCIACMFRNLAFQYWHASTSAGIPTALRAYVEACRICKFNRATPCMYSTFMET